MLARIGVDSVDDLFADVPERFRLEGLMNLPEPLTEIELQRAITEQAGRNVGPNDRVCLLGGGVYDHFIPAVVDEIAGRGEFYTAYTPYQPECSQGTLQAFFEYQSLACELTGMEVSNASLYEGGTSMSEAAFMAVRVSGRHGKIVVLGSVHPEYRAVLKTYLTRLESTLVEIPCPNGTVDPDEVAKAVDETTACVIFQHPNFFGCLEEAEAIVEKAHEVGAMAISVFDPLSVGLVKRPGEYGADIAVAEGQSLGVPMQYGGPYLGMFCCRSEYVRKMPGRLIGTTEDKNGKECFVLAMQTREQHIRRGKATSNICTNQGLLALRATIYLSLLGPEGLKEVGELCLRKAHYLADKLGEIDGLSLAFDRPFFKEFALKCDAGAEEVAARARAAGFDLGPRFQRVTADDDVNGLSGNSLLLAAVTEQRTREELDRLAAALR
ncbi:putative glycine dehydrogenase (decarboxylating) subunit 1 [Stratiformator vulcanicus]|uniref:Probable glycine dehydrogenase (decarboxylating) subunit 1 n=2 Tax=Stratiformator vulcanicus TaxID=2527980 RepID=A0A517R359_9PLAN|nr:putative glycine dehydrogenase (decarboxylating) subunit 1 [Stratiformator vulcanicus]